MKEIKIKRNYTDTADGQIHYCTAGSGYPVLLLHQTPSSFHEFDEVIPILAQHYLVIAMDTIGFGGSDKTKKEYSITEYAACVKKFLDSIGVSRTHVVGHHTGATIALEFAATYPEMVNKLVMDGLQYFRKAEDRLSYLKDPRFQPWDIKADGSHIDMAKEIFIKGRLPGAISVEKINVNAIDKLLAGGEGEYAHKACFLYDQTPALPKVKSPTLLTSGTRDMFYATLDEVKGLMQNCKCETATFEGGIGVVPQQFPKEFAEAVLKFLK